MDRNADVAVVGGGIAGLAFAYMALKKGLRVVLFEREHFAVGASVRNFGMVWPVGQEPHGGLDRAMRSLGHWKEIAEDAGIWYNPNGSLHLAYEDDEQAVLEEFVSAYRDFEYDVTMISPTDAVHRSPIIRKSGLKCALWSSTETIVYSREAIRRIPEWLEAKFGLIRRFGQVVTEIQLPTVKTPRESWQVGRVVICSGADFETLYPEHYARLEMTKCKLQMLKVVPNQPVKMGPSLCAGLTLRHYAAFSKCPTLQLVDRRFDQLDARLKKYGIHILVSQNHLGELIVGDSHQYYSTVEPFDLEEINELIIQYFTRFVDLSGFKITERWHGVYPKLAGQLHSISEPAAGVQVVNGLGGAGMTLSFGLAEEVVAAW